MPSKYDSGGGFKELTFRNPVTGKTLTFKVPVNSNFQPASKANGYKYVANKVAKKIV